MLSYRYNNAVRTAPRVLSSATSVLFQNNGIIVPARTHAASFEWKRFFKKDRNNRLLLTATNQLDDRRWIGQPFPGVSIFDGIGSIVFGSDAVTGVYHFKATDITANLMRVISLIILDIITSKMWLILWMALLLSGCNGHFLWWMTRPAIMHIRSERYGAVLL
jgi:hypothetical protein